MGGTATVYFTIADKTPPKVTVYTEAIYNHASFPLNFTVNEPTSWIAYSLDGGAKTAVTANTTLTVAAGEPTIVVYVNDTAGNVGQSEMAHFTVQASTWYQTSDIIIVVAIVLASIAAVAAVWLAYSKTRKHEIAITA
jgi:hypothetical protein